MEGGKNFVKALKKSIFILNVYVHGRSVIA